MLMEKARTDIVRYSQKLIEDGLTVGTGGNISVYDPEKKLFAISPSGLDYFETAPEDIVIVDLDGHVVEGDRRPSSEVDLHRIFYQKREDIRAVVHTHSTYCTVLATNRMPLPASSYLVAFAGRDVRCGRYATFGTPKLAEYTFEAMRDRKAALMANHGLITGGKDLPDAYTVALQIEFCAKVYVKALAIGDPVLLSDVQMKEALLRFGTYGQPKEPSMSPDPFEAPDSSV